MCTVCGCGDGETRIEGAHKHDDHHHHDHNHGHHHHHGHSHEHSHDHHHHEHSYHDQDHVHADGDNMHFGAGAAGTSVPGMSQKRLIQLEEDILGKNNRYAATNREMFERKGMFVLNLVSSPGSGKTTLLCRTLEAMKEELDLAVVEGDQQTTADADRIRATGVPAIQVNTGKGCHLDAHMVGHAVENLDLADGATLMIENVGNLVCPAGFDLGEAHKVAILSVTEGEDKPLKYPDMFAASDIVLLNKVDLLPHLDFDIDEAEANIRRVNPKARIMRVSARSGEGMDSWMRWLRGGAMMAAASLPDTAVAAE